MDGITILLAVIISGLFAAPFVLAAYNKKQTKSKYQQALSQSWPGKSLSLDAYDNWNGYAIGLDSRQQLLAYIRFDGEVAVEKQLVELAQFDSCNIRQETETADTGHRSTKRLGLQLSPRQLGSAAPCYLLFYDASANFMLSGELELTNKWSKIIRETMG
jgi:hypothetical protein